MNNPTPLVPQGTIDPKDKRRARVKIGVFFVLAVHGAGLLALLLQGCHREESPSQASLQSTNSPSPTFEATPAPTIADNPGATNQQSGTAGQAQEPSTAAIPNLAPANPAASEYTIASGDKLSTIARKFSITVAALKDANPGVEPTKLQIGKSLHIPAPAPKATAPAGSSAPSIAGTASEATNGSQIHTVKSGETLIKIAQLNHTTVKAIRAANNLKSDRITVGQKIKIPAKAAQTASTEPTATSTQVAASVPAAH
jgi:LysM repeat protein